MLAPAKINLFLHVAPRRDDGYHELEALVAFVGYGDDVVVERAGGLTLDVVGPFAAGLISEPEENIALRAARALQRKAADCGMSGLGARLRLTKNLPLASGIGGGSSDAAATLKSLCALWQMQPGDDALRELGLSLGADVPVCLFGRTAWMTGIGERLAPAPLLPPMSVVLANPMRPVPTAEVYRGFDRMLAAGACFAPVRRPSIFADADALIDFLRAQRNDLEPAARRLAPEIDAVLAELRQSGADLARMSGSGATCFALFSRDAVAREAADALARRHPDWWVVASEHMA